MLAVVQERNRAICPMYNLFTVQYKLKQPHELEEQQRGLSQKQTQLTDQHISKVSKVSKDML